MIGGERDMHFPFPECITETTALILQTSSLRDTSLCRSDDTEVLYGPAFIEIYWQNYTNISI